MILKIVDFMVCYILSTVTVLNAITADIENFNMIRIGTLLDACGILYAEEQLAKLEELVTNLINTKIYQTIQTLGYHKKSQEESRDLLKTSTQDLSKETTSENNESKVFAENIFSDKIVKNEVLETSTSNHSNVEKSNTQNNLAISERLDIKFEVDQIEPMAENSSVQPEKVNLSRLKPASVFVCGDCSLGFKTQIQLDLHARLIHKCTLSNAEREKEMWQCPVCQKMIKVAELFHHVTKCEPKMDKLLRGCPHCGKKFDNKNRYGNLMDCKYLVLLLYLFLKLLLIII